MIDSKKVEIEKLNVPIAKVGFNCKISRMKESEFIKFCDLHGYLGKPEELKARYSELAKEYKELYK